MQSSDIPPKFVQPFANNAGAGYIAYPVPNTAASPLASLDQGFPTSAFAAGGAPRGKDFNGVLKQTTAWARWISAAGVVPYDAAFQTAIGGYPKGAVLLQATGTNFWISTVENNMTNPDAAGAGWTAPSLANGSVTNAKLANMAAWTVKANATGSTAAPSDATFDFSGIASGSVQIGALIIKTGRVGPFAIDTGNSVTFATAFPNGVMPGGIKLTPELASGYTSSSDSWVVLDQGSLSTTGFSFHIASSANSQQLYVNWEAKGY